MENVITPIPAQFPQICELWEASVRATHGFLGEEDIAFYKEMVTSALPEMDVYILEDEGLPAAFLAVADDMIQALFVHPAKMRKGLGARLLNYAIRERKLKRVDVNEQNPSALAFYTRYGFRVIRRTETDGAGRPFPILQLSL